MQLVGVISLDNRPLNGGAHIVEQNDPDESAQLDRPHHRGLLFAGARQIYRAGAGQGRQVAPRHARLHLRSAAQAFRAGRDRQPSFLRSRREAHAWLTQLSPLRPVWQPGTHGNTAGGIGVVAHRDCSPARSSSSPHGAAQERALIAAIKTVTGLALPDGAGGGVVDRDQGRLRLRARKIPGRRPGRRTCGDPSQARSLSETGTVTDLSHGRTAIRISGPEGRMGAGEILRHRFRACRPFRSARASRPCITTSSRRSSAAAPTSSTSTSSAPSPARSGRRSAMPAKRSATR